MWTHFDTIEPLMREVSPSHVLELGALNGETTQQLLRLQPEIGFKLTVISDDADIDCGHPGFVKVVRGVSYTEIPKLEPESIDFCLLDTDHNYWTLGKELMALDSRLKVGAHVLIHDVETFYYDTGLADFYANGADYPNADIMEFAHRGSLGVAVLDFLSTYPFNYRLVSWTPRDHGMAVIKKNPAEISLNLLRPGQVGGGKRKGMVNV